MAKKKSGMLFHEAVEWMLRNRDQKLSVSGHPRYTTVSYDGEDIAARPGLGGDDDVDFHGNLGVYSEFRSCLFSVPDAVKPLPSDLETIISKFGCQAANVRELVEYLHKPKRQPKKVTAKKATTTK